LILENIIVLICGISCTVNLPCYLGLEFGSVPKSNAGVCMG